MKISIVHGFFLPIPPVAGGAMEKIWWRLAGEFASRGHDVLSVSRQWPGFPDRDVLSGVALRRLRGTNHSRHLPLNLVFDLVWSLRVLRQLPPADIVVSNNVSLPALLPRLRPDAGRVVANLNRFPKGQPRFWRRISRLQAASAHIAAAALRQAPHLAGRIRVVPNPVDLDRFRPRSHPPPPAAPVTFGFVGRIHPEKGIESLARATRMMAEMSGLPPWRLELRGPADVARGGGGPAFVRHVTGLAGPAATEGRFVIQPPEFDPANLAAIYRTFDVFVYPTQAEHGEASPVAVAEAQASGLPVMATGLDCFAGRLTPGQNSILLPLGAEPSAWARAMADLLRQPEHRARLAQAARESVAELGFGVQSEAMLADFATLLPPS